MFPASFAVCGWLSLGLSQSHTALLRFDSVTLEKHGRQWKCGVDGSPLWFPWQLHPMALVMSKVVALTRQTLIMKQLV